MGHKFEEGIYDSGIYWEHIYFFYNFFKLPHMRDNTSVKISCDSNLDLHLRCFFHFKRQLWCCLAISEKSNLQWMWKLVDKTPARVYGKGFIWVVAGTNRVSVLKKSCKKRKGEKNLTWYAPTRWTIMHALAKSMS